jgi:hypothetical protein
MICPRLNQGAVALPEFTLESSPRNTEQFALPPKSLGTRAVGSERQQPEQYIFAELVYALPGRRRVQVANGLETVPLANTIEHFKVYVGANYLDVRELGVVCEKLS